MVINYVDGMVWSCMWVHLIRDIMDCKSIQKNLIHCIVILSYDLANCVYKLIQIGETDSHVYSEREVYRLYHLCGFVHI